MQWSIGKGMIEYVNTKEVATLKPIVKLLAAEYKKTNDWSGMQNQNRKFIHFITKQLDGSDFLPAKPTQNRNERPFKQRPPAHQPPPDHSRPEIEPHNNAEPKRLPPPPDHEAHYVLFDAQQHFIVGNYEPKLKYSKTPIMVNEQLVGYFAVSKRNRLTQGYELDFIHQQQSFLWIIALVVMALVTLITLPLTRHVVEPIKLITRGMHKLTQGKYNQQIDLPRKDELGALSRDFNELANTLAANETMRKRWLANISHELRTPTAILQGELEAIIDNIRPLTKENIMSLNDEVKHLAHIIDDLHQLTSADVGGMRYQKQSENLTELMQANLGKYHTYLADAGISLKLSLPSEPVWIYADRTRLLQLFENIINNCIKYASAKQLIIALTLGELNTKPCAVITIEDDGLGVAQEHLAHLFEYLYRVDNARNRKTGGAGLGLSICHHIVTAHQGEIIAKKSNLGGLAITIKLPLTSYV